MKIIAFSKYLLYMLGGAEKSTYAILKQKSLNNDVQLISFKNIQSFGAESKTIKFPSDWKIDFLENMKFFNRFFYYEYLFNKGKLKNHFSNLDNNAILYTYAIYAPIAINSFEGKSKLFIRSETDLAINKNYYTGIKKILKYIYMALEYPAFYIYKQDLQKAIQKADVVCNSNYMAKKLKELYGKDSEVLYPYIDEERLKDEYSITKNEEEEKGIVFVGDAIIKGIEIAKDIAKSMPNEKFYFFSRYVDTPTNEDNIIWMPWQKREVDIYKYAKLVIVPSICEEAYGRVSREAYILNVPVLVSNIGGLPESVNNNSNFIVNDFKNFKEWIKRINND